MPNIDINKGSYLINFYRTTVQSRKVGVTVDEAGPVAFHSPYFESIGNGIAATQQPAVVTVVGGNYSNAAQISDGSGVLFSAFGGARISIAGAIPIQGVCNKVFHRDGTSAIGHRAAFLRYLGSGAYAETGGTRQVVISGAAR